MKKILLFLLIPTLLISRSYTGGDFELFYIKVIWSYNGAQLAFTKGDNIRIIDYNSREIIKYITIDKSIEKLYLSPNFLLTNNGDLYEIKSDYKQDINQLINQWDEVQLDEYNDIIFYIKDNNLYRYNLYSSTDNLVIKDVKEIKSISKKELLIIKRNNSVLIYNKMENNFRNLDIGKSKSIDLKIANKTNLYFLQNGKIHTINIHTNKEYSFDKISENFSFSDSSDYVIFPGGSTNHNTLIDIKYNEKSYIHINDKIFGFINDNDLLMTDLSSILFTAGKYIFDRRKYIEKFNDFRDIKKSNSIEAIYSHSSNSTIDFYINDYSANILLQVNDENMLKEYCVSDDKIFYNSQEDKEYYLNSINILKKHKKIEYDRITDIQYYNNKIYTLGGNKNGFYLRILDEDLVEEYSQRLNYGGGDIYFINKNELLIYGSTLEYINLEEVADYQLLTYMLNDAKSSTDGNYIAFYDDEKVWVYSINPIEYSRKEYKDLQSLNRAELIKYEKKIPNLDDLYIKNGYLIYTDHSQFVKYMPIKDINNIDSFKVELDFEDAEYAEYNYYINKMKIIGDTAYISTSYETLSMIGLDFIKTDVADNISENITDSQYIIDGEIDFDSELIEYLTIYDINGRVISNIEVNTQSYDLKKANLHNGIYLIGIKIKNKPKEIFEKYIRYSP